MAMTKEDKSELTKEVKECILSGITKKEGIANIFTSHPWWKESTINNYWKTFEKFDKWKGD